MKAAFIFSALLMTNLALANSELPSTLKCEADVTSSAVKKFELHNLNTDQPDATIPDTSLTEAGEEKSMLGLIFSNECDNYYEITLSTEDLIDLKNKKVTKVRGLINYADTELSDANDGTDREEARLVTCTL